MRRLAYLLPETQALLRSTVILTSIPQVVSELVQNSIDAGARHVDIGVNPNEWSCWVRDDGCGISSQDLSLIGRECDAGRYGGFCRSIMLPALAKQLPTRIAPILLVSQLTPNVCWRK